MSQNEKRLGQGINALFGSQEKIEQTDSSPFMWLTPAQLIPNPAQPRKTFEDTSLQELAESIRSQGILQPLLVRATQDPDKWQIIAGERRWRAAQIAEVEKIPVIINQLNDNDTMIAAMMENIHREELNPIERANGLETIKNTLGITQVELANYLGMQRSTVTNSLRLLNLPPTVKEYVASGKITPTQARCLVPLDGKAAEELCLRILESDMNTREIEEAASFWQKEGRFPWQKPDPHFKEENTRNNPDILRLANQIGRTLNCTAKINGTSEKGRINLIYTTNAQLFDLLEKLGLTLEAE